MGRSIPSWAAADLSQITLPLGFVAIALLVPLIEGAGDWRFAGRSRDNLYEPC
jgi:hypothetical protein